MVLPKENWLALILAIIGLVTIGGCIIQLVKAKHHPTPIVPF